MNNISDIIRKLIDTSQNLNYRMGGKPEEQVDERNELLCLALLDDGWVQNGFRHIEGSGDVIVHWVRADDRKSVRLSPNQQRRWVIELEKRKKM